MLNTSGKSSHPCLIPDLSTYASKFSHSIWCCWLYICHILPWLCWGMLLVDLVYLNILSWKDVVLYVMFSLYVSRQLYDFIFQFINVMYRMYWFAYVESSMHVRYEFHIICVIDFLCVIWFVNLVFCWGFLHLCSSGILDYDFLSHWNEGDSS